MEKIINIKTGVSFFVIIVVFIFSLTGCGPQKSAIETDREQFSQTNKANVKKKMEELSPLTGYYLGTAVVKDMDTNTEKEFISSLELNLRTKIVSDTSRNVNIEVTDLEGILSIYRSSNLIPSEIRNVFVFDQSIWDEVQKKLTLYGQGASSEASGGKNNINLIGIFDQNVIEGYVATSFNSKAVSFKVKKVE